MPEEPFTTSDFHGVVQKQIYNAVSETLAETKLDWSVVEPFLEAARELCRSDVRYGGARAGIHGLRTEGDGWADSEEAYLALSVRGREDGAEWLSETWWVSDLVLADPDPARVRSGVAALERSLIRLRAWLDEHSEEGPGEAP